MLCSLTPVARITGRDTEIWLTLCVIQPCMHAAFNLMRRRILREHAGLNLSRMVGDVHPTILRRLPASPKDQDVPSPLPLNWPLSSWTTEQLVAALSPERYLMKTFYLTGWPSCRQLGNHWQDFDAMTSGIVRDVAVTVITVIPCWIIKVGILAVVLGGLPTHQPHHSQL